MKNLKYFYPVVITFVLAFAILFSGCNSTNSGENDEDSTPVLFNSGEIAPGETFTFTFQEEGNVDYYCEIHAPDMQGEISISSSEEAVERDTIRMENNQFIPSNLSIAPNTAVVWVNDEDHAHHVRSGNPSSDDGDDGGY